MKLSKHFNITACALCLALFSCSQEEEKTPPSYPSLPEMGITNPVTSIVSNIGYYAQFTYKDGKLVEGDTRNHGTFTIDYNPLNVNTSYSYINEEEGFSDVSTGEIYNIKTNAQGFVTSHKISQTEESTIDMTKENVTGSANGSGNIEYTAEGYIKKMTTNISRQRTTTSLEDGLSIKTNDTSTETIYFDWSNGNLNSLTITRELIQDKQKPQQETYKYVFEYDDTPNNGIYHWAELCNGMTTYNFCFYGGFLGKTSKNIPSKMKSYYADALDYTYAINATTEGNKISSISNETATYNYRYADSAPQNVKHKNRNYKRTGLYNAMN